MMAEQLERLVLKFEANHLIFVVVRVPEMNPGLTLMFGAEKAKMTLHFTFSSGSMVIRLIEAFAQIF